MSRPEDAPPVLAGAASACAANLLAALLLALALGFAQAKGALGAAALAAGVVLAAALVAAAALLWRRRLDAFRLASLPALALMAAAAAAYGAAALPADVHLRTLGRPPEFLWPLACVLGLALVLQLLLVARGESPARAGLLVLLPALTLEGLPLGAPPACAAAAGGILLLLSAPEAPRARLPLVVPIGLFLACTALSTAFAADPTPGVSVVLRLAALFSAFVLLAGDPRPERAARLGLAALLVTLLLVALAALSVHWRLKSSLAEFGADAMVTELSLFGRHPNVLAPWFGAGAVLSLHLAFTRASRLRLLAALAFLPATACLLLTASRLAIAASLAGVFLPVLFGLRRARFVMLAAVGAVAVISVALVLSPALRDKSLNKARHANILGESHRLHRMETALATAEERPWIGHGPLCWFRQGAFAAHSRFDGESTADHPHCLPLALLESTGILGSAAFLALLLAAALLLRQNLRDQDGARRQGSAAVASALAVQLLTNLLDAGDALETLIPSRLLIDLGLLAALYRAGRPDASAPAWSAFVPRLAGGLLLTCASLLLLFGEGLIELGAARARQGQPARAAETLKTAAALLPFHVPVRARLIGLGLATDDLSLSRTYLRDAEELAPDLPELHETRARLQRSLGNPGAAMLAAQAAFDLDPTGVTGLRLAPLLAELRLANADRAGGVQALAAAARHDYMALAPFVGPGRKDVLKVGQVEVPLADLLAALDDPLGPGASARERRRVPLRECDIHLLVGDHDAALRALERVAEIDGERGVTYHQFVARVLCARGDLAGALAANDRAIACVDSPYLRADRCDILMAMNRPAEAMQACAQGLVLSIDAHFGEAIYREILQKLEQASAAAGDGARRRDALRQLAFFTPDDLERAGILLSLAEAEQDAGQAGAARAALERSLTLVLATGASDEASALADRIGRALAAAGLELGSPSALADELERRAWRSGGGPVLHSFRVALLEALGLEARAAEAQKDLDAAERERGGKRGRR